MGRLPRRREGRRGQGDRQPPARITATASKAALPKGGDATAGRLHNDTAYGFTGAKENGVDLVVHRVPLLSLKPGRSRGRRSPRSPTTPCARPWRPPPPVWRARPSPRRWSSSPGPIRSSTASAACGCLEPLSVIPIRDKAGRAYKGYKGDANYRYDVWELAGGKWVAEVVSMFDAHQPGWGLSDPQRAPQPAEGLEPAPRRPAGPLSGKAASAKLMRVVKFSVRTSSRSRPPTRPAP